MTTANQEIANQIEIAMDALEKASNIMGHDFAKDLIRDRLYRMHRTLQQNIMRLLINGFFRTWHEMELRGSFDLRNQDTVQLASHVTRLVDEENICFNYV